jgi:Methyltransferase domain
MRAGTPPAAPSAAFAFYLRLSAAIPGWTRGAEAEELMRLSHALPAGAQLVEIGAFFGSGSILLAGARRLRGSGMVHCVDPFDGGGDAFSIPYYREILRHSGGGAPRDHFASNIRDAGLAAWVQIHQARAEELAGRWSGMVDLLFLDGDQSPASVREVYRGWIPYLKPGGVIALHNSGPSNRRPGHDGHRCVAEDEIRPPNFADIRLVGSTTFAVRQRA